MWAPEIILVTLFLCFFPWPWVFFSHICADQYKTNDLRGPFCVCLELFLCAALSSLMLFSINHSCLVPPEHQSLSLQLSETAELCWVLSSCTAFWKLLQGSAVVGLTLFPYTWGLQSFTACCPVSEKHSLIYFV